MGIFLLILIRAVFSHGSTGAAWCDDMLQTRIKEYREKRGMKQSELAALVGVRRETIVHLENGRYNPSLKLAMDIAKVFHTTVEELFAFTD